MMDTQPELSRPYRVDQIPTSGLNFKIIPTDEERAALASRFGVLEITALHAEIRLKAMSGGRLFRLDGHLCADVVQSCVVTLEPLSASVDEAFTMTYTLDVEDGEGAEIDLYMDEADPPDIIENGVIDAGEAVAEHLALALDPFPRHPDAAFTEIDEAPEEPKKTNPFEVLRKLQKKVP